jgi:hypothetical protein
MPVQWTTKSREVHTSRAIWVGAKPKDGGVALLLEALEWARHNRQAGKMTLNLGTGGSISDIEFEQAELIATPPADEDEDDELPFAEE